MPADHGTPADRPTEADLDLFGLTHVGRVRSRNEDQFLICSLHKLVQVFQTSLSTDDLQDLVSDSRGFLFLVADGVGGGPGGREASAAALRAIAGYVTHTMRPYYQADPDEEPRFLADLERSVLESHRTVREEALRLGFTKGMATTLTMVAVLWPRAYLIHVGDSRCYRLRDDRLELMSRDQTLADSLVRTGAMTPEMAEKSHLKHMLVSAVGGHDATPMTLATDVRWDDVMLLCTDGLTKHVSEAEIAAELSAMDSAEQACVRLRDLALERGGSDNVTIVVGRIRRDARRADPLRDLRAF